MKDVLRIGNCSGFYGDRLSAAREMVEGGELDVLTGDYLAELTMYILWRARQSDRPGYTVTFLKQMEQVLGTCVDRGVRIVTNAGGLDPGGLARDLRALSDTLGISLKIAHIEGDDLVPRLADLQSAGHEFKNLDTGALLATSGMTPVTANAYLGGRGIARALSEGADVVVCPRITDASLVVGPCMWNFGWGVNDLDALAGGVAAGHIIECGAQATGGNYVRFFEIDDDVLPGFPIAEMSADGSSVITKHLGTPGQVSVDTITAQLVYEVDAVEYPNPDVTLLLDTIHVEQLSRDRVRVSGAKGIAPPSTTKVSASCVGPYRQSVAFALTGRNIEVKADFVRAGLSRSIDESDFDAMTWRLVRTDHADAVVNELAVAKCVVTFTSTDKQKLGRRIFDAVHGLGLSSYPGFFLLEESQRQPMQIGIHWPCLIPQSEITQTVHVEGREAITVESEAPTVAPTPAVPSLDLLPSIDSLLSGDHVVAELGEVFLARSGDKGANANVGLWARSDEAYAWLRHFLTVEMFRQLVPESGDLAVTFAELPHLRAINVVVHGLLGGGAASHDRPDTQAKGLGEYVLSRTVPLPAALLPAARKAQPAKVDAA
jgi:Acyclic terpene utilisation family protein AtuA